MKAEGRPRTGLLLRFGVVAPRCCEGDGKLVLLDQCRSAWNVWSCVMCVVFKTERGPAESTRPAIRVKKHRRARVGHTRTAGDRGRRGSTGQGGGTGCGGAAIAATPAFQAAPPATEATASAGNDARGTADGTGEQSPAVVASLATSSAHGRGERSNQAFATVHCDLPNAAAGTKGCPISETKSQCRLEGKRRA